MNWSNYSLMTREDNNAKGDDILIGTRWDQSTQQHVVIDDNNSSFYARAAFHSNTKETSDKMERHKEKVRREMSIQYYNRTQLTHARSLSFDDVIKHGRQTSEMNIQSTNVLVLDTEFQQNEDKYLLLELHIKKMDDNDFVYSGRRYCLSCCISKLSLLLTYTSFYRTCMSSKCSITRPRRSKFDWSNKRHSRAWWETTIRCSQWIR